MIAATSVLLLIFLFWGLRQGSLIYSEPCSKEPLSDILSRIPPTSKLLDVRDMTDFEAAHIADSINISLGRLPYVWEKELSPEDEVILLADSCLKGRKAARILRKRGFRKVHTMQGTVINHLDLLKGKR